MEDMFGYLMKAEAEEHLMSVFSCLADQVCMSWGGRHSSDETICKIVRSSVTGNTLDSESSIEGSNPSS